jgi:hypothetical protein
MGVIMEKVVNRGNERRKGAMKGHELYKERKEADNCREKG